MFGAPVLPIERRIILWSVFGCKIFVGERRVPCTINGEPILLVMMLSGKQSEPVEVDEVKCVLSDKLYGLSKSESIFCLIGRILAAFLIESPVRLPHRVFRSPIIKKGYLS